jgi:hypothetical protein
LREQNLYGIYIRGVTDNTGISSKEPKEKYIYSKKQTNERQDMRSDDIIESRSIKYEIGQRKCHYQD